MTAVDLRKGNLAFLEQAAAPVAEALSHLPPSAPAAPSPEPPANPTFMSRLAVQAPEPEGRDPYLTRFIQDILTEARAADIPLLSSPTFTLSCALMVMGTLETRGLLNFVRKTRCIYLFVVIDDLERFNANLDLVDWPATARQVRNHGGEIFFIPSDDPVVIAGKAYSTLSATAPWALDAMTIAAFGPVPITQPLADTLGRLGYRALSTLGTFYDNCLMLRNSETNLRQPKSFLYTRRARPARNLPAWVIGSGPSLDTDLAFLKKNQDRAVMISCGSALAPLIAAGICPDFHVELENLNVGMVLDPVARSFDLSPIPLVAPISVDPDAVGKFRCTVFTSRQNLPTHSLYALDMDCQPILGEPTVSNLALAFAREQNFPEICFFGTDMGARDRDRDHADGTWHRTSGDDYHAPEYDIPVPGNFGGTCQTSAGLYQALQALSLAVKHDPSDRIYLNCSDGAAIEGARAVRSADLTPPPATQPKQKTVAAILDDFVPWNASRMPSPWPGPEMIVEIEGQFQQLRGILKGIRNFADKAYIPMAGQVFRYAEGHTELAPAGAKSAANILVRGTVGMHLVFMEYFLNRLSTPDHLAHMGQACLRFLDRSLNEILADARDRIGGDRVRNIPDFDAIRTPPGAQFPPGPPMPRNAPCPCGSGKRYKQCHGRTA